MYFAIGWPKFFNSKTQTGVEDILKIIKFNRSRSLFVTVSNTCIYLWKTRPRVILSIWHRDEKSIHEQGINKDVYWNPDSSMLAIVTEDGFVILLDIFEVEKEYVYYLEPVSSRYPPEQLKHNGIPKVNLTHRLNVTLKGKITCITPRIDELFITTTEGWIYRLSWAGAINSELSCHISDLLFCVDLETPTVGSPLSKEKNIYITKIECSPVLGGFAIILSDGRGGFLSSSTADSKPQEIVGIFAKDLTNAVSLSVNIKYQIIVYGQTNGQATAYTFDDITGGLIVSHKYVLPKKDYPDQGANSGSVFMVSWTPDGCALATLWSSSGIAIWSIFGALLMCVRSSDHCGDVFRHDAIPIACMDWGLEGYELLLLPKNAENHDVSQGDILQLNFVKSALSVNPCMSNRQQLFLQGADSVYLNTGDVMLQTTQGAMLDGNGNGMNSPSMHFSNKHWQTFQLPPHYVTSNWPIRYAAIDDSSKYLAVAGMHGYAHFSLARRKWKLFGNETQEQNVICRGGLTWWQNFLVVGCYSIQDELDEVRLHSRTSNLDVTLACRVQTSSPIFLINTFNDILLVYCSDCSITFYRMAMVDEKIHGSGVSVTKLSETTLIDYIIHPITVTSLSLTGLKSEQSSTEHSNDTKEAHSLIANVAGRVLMLQKDKPAEERTSKKIQFLTPVVLASWVESIWYMVNPMSSKQHLAESLWLACGAQGMQAWLPLFPTRRPLGFLSKRIMLHFNLQLYPLAVLFEDAVIIGIGNEDIDDCLTPSPLFGASMPFPYFTLERTTQVYLPQILKQLLRRNLGVHALDIARSCTNLPYFTHVLELMLHEVLEKEATASNPIPDPLLPRIVAFIQEFPQFLETVCHCARKTEVALWNHLFSVVGNPINLFKSCHSTGKLETAASYLLVIQNLETPATSRQHATLLLETALEQHKWQLAKDLVRFLRAIGQGDNESPPRTPLYFGHKTSFHQNMSTSLNLSSVNLDDSMSAPVRLPLQRQSSRSSIPPANSHSRTSSINSKERGEKQRPVNLKLGKRESNEKFSSPSKPVTVESCEHFYTEMILSRHARKLLSSYSIKDLGLFTSHLEFDIIPWLTKERFRAVNIDSFVDSLSSLHEQFDWPYPTLESVNEHALYLRSQSLLAQKDNNRLSIPHGIATPTSPLGSELSYPNTTGDDIEAHLHTERDDVSVTTGTEQISDTCSFITLDEVGNEAMETPFQNLNEMKKALLQSKKAGPPKSQAKLKYMLKLFMEARCLDWVIVVALMLFDLPRFNKVVEKVASFKDLTKSRLDNLLVLLHELYDWLEHKCPAYQPLLNTIIANCETLYNSTAAETIQSSNTPDDEIVSSPRKPSQESELTSDSEKITTEGEKEEKNVNEEEESSECSIM